MKISIAENLAFNSSYNTIRNEKMPIKLAYKLSKINSSVEENQKFYQDQLNKIIDTYGERDENGKYVTTDDGQGVKVADANTLKVREEINSLLELEVTVPDITLDLEELGSINMTPQDMQGFLPFIGEGN